MDLKIECETELLNLMNKLYLMAITMTLDQKIEFIANKAYEQATSRELIMAYNKQSIRLLDQIVNTLLYLRNTPKLLKK